MVKYLDSDGLIKVWDSIKRYYSSKLDEKVNIGDIPFEKSTGVGSAIQTKEVDSFVDENPDASTSGQEILTEASGNYSVVLNGKSRAGAKRALAHGNRTIAQGENSHTEGHCTQTLNIDDVTNGYAAHAEGYGSMAGGTYSHAEGNRTKTAAPNSHAEGYLSITTPEAESSHAEGYETSAEAPASHTEGNNTKTHKAYSHAEGRQTETFGEASHTEGNETFTEGDYAHAEGWMTRAKGAYSHAEGQYTFTYADAAHSEGNNTHAQAPFSHAEGLGTKTNPDIIGQHVEGYYNAESDGVKVIGCGTADDARLNAVEVKQDGRVFVKGLGNFDGTNSNEAADLVHVVGSKANNDDVYNKTEMDNRIESDLVQKVEVATINGQSLINGGNIVIEDSDDVFVAEYGVTDYDEVISAYNSGKICICKYINNIYYGYNVDPSTSRFIFTCINHYASSGGNSIELSYIIVRKTLSGTSWEPIVTKSVEKSDNKTDTINVESTDIQYPSAKAVYDALTVKADKTELTDLSEKVESITPMTYVTYAELKSLRDNFQLVPGRQYRITDYVTTTIQENTQSAGHQFDVIVTADDEFTLNENVRAIQHEGDTYFADNDLNAWQIWYSLDNDVERFGWADTENGKGVIYRMIDEYDNDCPYDFKNIMFKRKLTNGALDTENGIDTWCYTFNAYCTDNTNIYDASVIARKEMIDDDANRCYGNIIKEYYTYLNNEGLNLNDIVFLNIYSIEEQMYFHCYSNSFGDSCYSNSFGDSCYSHSFGDDCNSNSFGDDCNSNSFGNNCYSNSFGNNCRYNSFRGGCYSNSFGNNCGYNSFENGCYFNSFGYNCGYNSFENGCYYNSFGDTCYSNFFANSCQNNSFGNNCSYNSFGNVCYYNSFRVSADRSSSLKNYVRYNHFDDGCSYNVIWNSDITSSSALLKNINVNRGVCGTNNSYNMINIDTLNQDYEIQVAKNSNGEIKIYCEADLIA